MRRNENQRKEIMIDNFFIEKLKEIKEAIKQDAHEHPSYDKMNSRRDEYFLLLAIEQYLEYND